MKEGERHIVQIEIRSFDDDIVQPLLSMVAGKDDMVCLIICIIRLILYIGREPTI